MTQEKKIGYSFIPVPKEIYKELEGDELKLFLHLIDECGKYERQDKTYHPNQKNLSKDLGWGLNCIRLKRNINSLSEKNLIEVNVGTYLTNDPTASEYHINWKTVNSYRHQNSDGDDMDDDNHRHQNSDATKNIYNITIYTIEFLKERFPNGIGPGEIDGMLDGMRTYIMDRMSERSDGRTTEMNGDIPSTLGNTIYTMEVEAPAPPQHQDPNKDAGGADGERMEQLPTQEEIERQEARKDEIRQFNAGYDRHKKDLYNNVRCTADFDRFNNLILKDIAYVKGSDWSQARKDEFMRNHRKWWERSKKYILSNLERLKKKEADRTDDMNSKYESHTYRESSISKGDASVYMYWLGLLRKPETELQREEAEVMLSKTRESWNKKYESAAIEEFIRNACQMGA